MLSAYFKLYVQYYVHTVQYNAPPHTHAHKHTWENTLISYCRNLSHPLLRLSVLSLYLLIFSIQTLLGYRPWKEGRVAEEEEEKEHQDKYTTHILYLSDGFQTLTGLAH